MVSTTSFTVQRDDGTWWAWDREVDGGFQYAGAVYRSLSAAAKAITGSHCSGNAFFGLTKEAKRS